MARVIGGAERVLYEQSTPLRQRGHSVDVLTRRLPIHKDVHEKIEGVHEWRYAVDGTSSLSFLRSTRVNGRRLLESIIKDRSFDVVNFQQPFTAHAILESPASRTLPKVYTSLSLSFEEFLSRNPAPERWTQKLAYRANVAARRWIERRALAQSDRIIVLSRFSRDKLERYHRIAPAKITLIPGGVSLGRFHPASDKAEIRRRLRLPENSFLLLTVRNLVPRMGLDRFILALPEVLNVLKDVHVVIGGAGPLEEHLKSLTRSQGLESVVHFAGYISDDDLPDYYRAADLFILPTLELEGFGLVTLEALASGLPVLGTTVGGTQEILEQLDQRYLFDDTSAEAMARRIIDIGRQYIERPELARTASMKCRAFAENHYSWERNVDLLEDLFRTVFRR
jgi:glycosyltransferase involved in cell wall biosynthesis